MPMEQSSEKFRFLAGPSSRISMDTTPYHKGWLYYCTDTKKLYLDFEVAGTPKRICLNDGGGGSASGVKNWGDLLSKT